MKKAKDDDFAQSLLRFDLPVKSPDQKSSNSAKQKVEINFSTCMQISVP